jgi:chorismate dehydratase
MNVEKVKVSCVSYLNSMPFIYGLRNHPISGEIDLSLDIPSVCASKLISGVAQIGLVPVASIPLIKNARVISDFCIGASGPVTSVMLFSDVPLNEITAVLLDYQSMTSVNLVKVLSHQLWKIHPEWLQAKPGYENEITGTVAGVIIGDRALADANRFKYSYDLSEEWMKMTGLPFVFACWVSNTELAPEFISSFNEALLFGLSHLEDSLVNFREEKISGETALNYLRNYIDYKLDQPKKLALEKFLFLLKQTNAV